MNVQHIADDGWLGLHVTSKTTKCSKHQGWQCQVAQADYHNSEGCSQLTMKRHTILLFDIRVLPFNLNLGRIQPKNLLVAFLLSSAKPVSCGLSRPFCLAFDLPLDRPAAPMSDDLAGLCASSPSSSSTPAAEVDKNL